MTTRGLIIKLNINDKENKHYSYIVNEKNGNEKLAVLDFKITDNFCVFQYNLTEKAYDQDLFNEMLLPIVIQLFQFGYDGIVAVPNNERDIKILQNFNFEPIGNGEYYLESRKKHKVKFNKDNISRYKELYSSLVNDERVQKMREVSQHRGSNSYEHCCKVTRLAYRLTKFFNIKSDYESIIRAGMLHDFYLYDWRKEPEKKKHHGTMHPYIAMKNADNIFKLNYLEKVIILDHMWPLNFSSFQNKWEVKVVAYSDKIISITEALTSKRYKTLRRKSILNKLKSL